MNGNATTSSLSNDNCKRIHFSFSTVITINWFIHHTYVHPAMAMVSNSRLECYPMGYHEHSAYHRLKHAIDPFALEFPPRPIDDDSMHQSLSLVFIDNGVGKILV